MIIIRTNQKPRIKLFGKISKMPEKFLIPTEWEGKYDKIVADVKTSTRYDEEIKDFTKPERDLIKAYKKDLYDWYLYEDNPLRPDGQTEYLEEFSKPFKKVKPFHRLTKRINNSDRFDYLIYPPVLDEENRKVIVPIVIQSLKGHNIAGQTTYSKID